MTINQLNCPTCQEAVELSFKGNVLDMPLTCPACTQAFWPHFYCPDAKRLSEERHIFKAESLYLDNMAQVYTFCPAHTFTTYALVTHKKSSLSLSSFLQVINDLYSTLTFRLALFMEGLRQVAFSK